MAGKLSEEAMEQLTKALRIIAEEVCKDTRPVALQINISGTFTTFEDGGETHPAVGGVALQITTAGAKGPHQETPVDQKAVQAAVEKLLNDIKDKRKT